MEYRKLGQTELKVSLICLGSMTWGEQNSESEAHQQLDYAFERGVNFIDTAEMYAVPPREATQGKTEECIGTWLKNQQRDKVILATKIVGRSDRFPYLREGKSRFTADHIDQALEASLKRLQTDYVDLYQLHWPDRQTNFFGSLGYSHNEKDNPIPIEETLNALHKHVKSGKIRYIGLSNETPWGVMRFLSLAKEFDLPRVVSVQNPYSLLNRSYEVGLAEISIREKCGLLAYSPLAFGTLSGKYLNNQRPEKARLTLFSVMQRYQGALAEKAVEKYVEIAKAYELTPAQMALAYVNSRPFLTSNIIGATTLEQLKENIETAGIKLSDECLNEIEYVYTQIPNPCP